MNTYPTEAKRQPVASTTASFCVLVLLTLAVIVASPYVPTAARAVVNLPVSAVAVVWGRVHGGDCDVHADLIVTCAGMTSGFKRGGTTLGNVWFFRTLGGPARHRHEARHATQWAVFGLGFPALYLADCILAGGDAEGMWFELSAGLRDGGYLR
jgi:hypothetical protein